MYVIQFVGKRNSIGYDMSKVTYYHENIPGCFREVDDIRCATTFDNQEDCKSLIALSDMLCRFTQAHHVEVKEVL